MRFVFHNSASILSSPSTGFPFVFFLDPRGKTSCFKRPLLSASIGCILFLGEGLLLGSASLGQACYYCSYTCGCTFANTSSIVSHCLTIVDMFPLCTCPFILSLPWATTGLAGHLGLHKALSACCSQPCRPPLARH